MTGFVPILAVLAFMMIVVGAVYGMARLVRLARAPLVASPFTGGLAPAEQAVSRFHVRWYPVTMLFLAFDMEMVFMYPWTRVITTVGASAVIEMFTFLAILTVGIVYAWREGALRWT